MKPPYVERTPAESRTRQLRLLVGEAILIVSGAIGLLKLDAFGQSQSIRRARSTEAREREPAATPNPR